MLPSDSARAFRVGVAGPVGSGKTALVDQLTRQRWPRTNLAVVTNDILSYTSAGNVSAYVRPLRRGDCPHQHHVHV
jgi:urease accessory protein